MFAHSQIAELKKRVQLLLVLEEKKLALINAGLYTPREDEQEDKKEQSEQDAPQSGETTPKAQEQDNVEQS